MKVQLITDSKHGKTGATLTGPEVWRLSFPVKGCVAKAIDAEAAKAVLAEINTTSGTVRQRLVMQMTEAGSMPDEDGVTPTVTEKPVVEPLIPAKAPAPKPESSAGIHPHSAPKSKAGT